VAYRILVTGWGRAGTQYAARLLTALGVPCTHEQVYRHDLDPCRPWSAAAELSDRWRGKPACASWLAVPFLSQLPADVVVWHQRRDPLKVVRCWRDNGLLSNDDASARFVRALLPECREGTDLERAVWYCLRWGQMVRAAHWAGDFTLYGYNVEDLNAGRLRGWLAACGHEVSAEAVAGAMAAVPPGIGACGRPHGPLTWDEIRAVRGGQELASLARGYGYEVG